MDVILTANLITCDKKRRILLIKRFCVSAEAGLWSLPGGTKKARESIEDTLRREIEEEIGQKPKKFKFFRKYKIAFKDKVVLAHYFVGVIGDDIIVNNKEIEQYKWFTEDTIPDNLAYGQNKVIEDFMRQETSFK